RPCARPRARSWAVAFLASSLLSLLAACGSKPTVDESASPSVKSGPATDGPSDMRISAADVKDAVPRNEPLASYGNHSPYEVFGKKYRVMNTSRGYRERGIASWYGAKFHGRRTSSGEPYDMHLATAAHKTLPLPTYAEVTNLDNGKKVIVKINDRGPFKDQRLIDMSYAAAIRLDMIGKGTANVEVRVIDTSKLPKATASELQVPGVTGGEETVFLQMGAFSREDSAEELAGRLEAVDLKPTSILKGNKTYRVWIGPYTTAREADTMIQRAIELGFERPHRVKP
ncbi:MAG TPA: septal ring lytic transglycosylase RlpA family protein, partial [Xanthomonadales bacterium]|nr:septal ring lytic transglycosylase RlpA family protein [Xanthomonadales bacterium]